MSEVIARLQTILSTPGPFHKAPLYDIVSRHREQVLALFHGHFHNGLRGWDDRAPLLEICFPSALYNQDRRLEEQKAAGFNPSEFRPGYCLATIGEGKLTLQYKPVGDEVALERSVEVAAAK